MYPLPSWNQSQYQGPVTSQHVGQKLGLPGRRRNGYHSKELQELASHPWKEPGERTGSCLLNGGQSDWDVS